MEYVTNKEVLKMLFNKFEDKIEILEPQKQADLLEELTKILNDMYFE